MTVEQDRLEYCQRSYEHKLEEDGLEKGIVTFGKEMEFSCPVQQRKEKLHVDTDTTAMQVMDQASWA